MGLTTNRLVNVMLLKTVLMVYFLLSYVFSCFIILLFVQELMLHILVHEIKYWFEFFNFEKQINVTLRWDFHYLFMLQIFPILFFSIPPRQTKQWEMEMGEKKREEEQSMRESKRKR